MKLCIVRHGQAVPGQVDDIYRPLTDEGLQQAERAGHWLRKQNLSAAAIWASPYLRTQQTAAAINQSLSASLVSAPSLVPAMSSDAVLEELVNLQQDLVLVSHLPLVGRLAARLIDGEEYDQPWSPAECWLLEGDIFASGCMTVSAVWYPALD